jgi:hypothetical protein
MAHPAARSRPRTDGGKEVPMSIPNVRRFRSLLVAWLLAAGLVIAQVATALAEGNGGQYPR